MDLGLYLLFQASPGETPVEGLQRGLVEAHYIENLGLDTIWLGNTSTWANQADGAYTFGLPPFVAATHLASATKRVRIGTAVSYLPLFHPVDTARFTASIDHLSGGRFVLGVGRGIGMSYGDAGFRRDHAGPGWIHTSGGDARAVYLEAVEVTKGFLENEAFSYEGKYYQFSGARSKPRSMTPRVPMFAAVQSAQSFHEMGKLGLHLLIPLPGYHSGPVTWGETKELLDAYRLAWAEAGHPGEPQIVVRAPFFIHETDSGALEFATRVMTTKDEHQARVLGGEGGGLDAMGVNPNRPDEIKALMGSVREQNSAQRRAMGWPTIEEEIAHGTITGGPQTVTEILQRLSSELGVTGTCLEYQYWTTTRDEQMRSLRLLAEAVAPKLS